MSKNFEHLQHVKSNVVVEGQPKLPQANKLVEGELAINYAEGYETISFKNSNDDIIRFSSDEYYTKQKLGSGFTSANSANTVTSVIESNERITASALNDLYATKLDASAYTPTDLSDYYTKEETNAEISSAISGKTDTSAFTEHTSNDSIHHTHSNKTYLDGITGTVGTMAYENTSSYSSATEVNTALGTKVNTVDIDQVLDDTVSASTNPVSSKAVYKAVTDNELVWVNAYVTLSGAVSSHTSNSDIHVTTADKTAWNAKADLADIPSVSEYADSVKYNDTTHYMEFYHGTTAGTKVYEFDASPFIIDGMVQNVEIKDVTSGASTVTCLVVSFNTDARKQDINIPLTDIFDASNYYDKTAIDTKLGSGFTVSSVTEVIEENEEIVSTAINELTLNKLDASAYTPTDLSDYYTKEETSGASEIASAFTEVTDYIEGKELAISAALTDLEANKLDATAYTPTDLSDYYTKEETSGKTELSIAFGTKVNTAIFTAHTANTTIHLTSGDVKTQIDNRLGSAFTSSNSAVTVTERIEEDEEITAIALNDLNTRKLDASAYTPTDLSNYYTKSETSGATEISTALGTKVNTTDIVSSITSANSASTNPVSVGAVMTVIAEDERVTSSALNDLETNKLDATAYTPTDLSDYYTSAQTEAAISSAISGKVDTTTFDEIVGSGYTNTTITEVIENMDNAIAAALADLDDKIGDIESILATI